MLEVKIDTIKKLNPWHKTGKVPDKFLKPFRRRELRYLEKSLKNIELATLLVGGRRVGKSVLMYQLIDRLLRQGIDPKRILFIQGDNNILRESIEKNVISELINIYGKYILDEELSEITKTVYIFVDEAQALPRWENEVKTFLDLKYPTKFFLTGSSSHKLRGGKQAPLVGRVDLNLLTPFSFRDFVGYKTGIRKWKQLAPGITKLSDALLEDLKSDNKIDEIFDKAKKISSVGKLDLQNLFENFLHYGGFPYVMVNSEKEDVQKYLLDILAMTFSRDLLFEDQIREPKAFERLMTNLCMLISSTYKLKTLSERIGVKDERTVRRYIDYYVESHYVYQSPRYAKHHKQTSVKQDKKIYIADTGLINTLLFKSAKDIVNDKEYRGALIENAVHNSLINHKLTTQNAIFGNIPHWRNNKNKKEIDFVYSIDNTTLPIEVKTTERIEKESFDELRSFLLVNKKISKMGIVVTENAFKTEGNILFIPAYLLAYIL